MNSPASVTGPGDGLGGRVPKRALIALALSLAVHALLVGGVVFGPFDFHPAEEPSVVQARLLPPPPPPAPAPQLQPETQLKTPVHHPATPHPAPRHAPPVLRAPAPSDSTVAEAAPGPAVEASGPAQAPAPAAAPPVPPSPAPVPPAAAKPSPLPAHARIEFELNIEAKRFKATTVQEWRMQDGNYDVRMSGAALIFIKVFRVAFESRGTVAGGQLVPTRYSDDRDGHVNAIDFNTQAQSAQVHEASGNEKSIALTAPPADPMSLPYALALNPDMPVGTVLMAANKENIEPVHLVARRDEPLYTDHFAANTRFYDFRRADGVGGVQVWLSLDKHWLPVKLRISGRDGPVSFTATRYELDPPQK
ncbi:MAG TPA: DUF3108 domain-containing protein [Burkholderiales bacterium]